MGMFDLYQSPYGQNTGPAGAPRQSIVPAHVIDVCMDKDSPMYETPADIGKIRYRDVVNLSPFRSRIEEDITTEAYPMDRALGRYPLPGEQVMVFEAFGDVKLPNGSTLQRIAFYAFNVNTNHTITSNQTPYIISNSNLVTNRFISNSSAKTRFERKLAEPKEYRDGGEVKIYPQLQPYEGDFIIQGRFGNSIRLGSTAPKIEKKRSKDQEALPWKSYGLPGDPIISLRVNSEYVVDADDMFVVEDPSRDQGSIYLCSTQNIELELQIPKRMKTWEETYTVTAGSDQADDQIKSTSKLLEDLYSKVVEIDGDVHEQLSPLELGVVPTTGGPTTTQPTIDIASALEDSENTD